MMVFRPRCTHIIINFDWSSDAVEDLSRLGFQALHCAVSETETELASASAINDKREEAIDDRLCDDMMSPYKVRYLGKYLG